MLQHKQVNMTTMASYCNNNYLTVVDYIIIILILILILVLINSNSRKYLHSKTLVTIEFAWFFFHAINLVCLKYCSLATCMNLVAYMFSFNSSLTGKYGVRYIRQCTLDLFPLDFKRLKVFTTNNYY